MKHEEFLELLNLYLDHEISAEDALRLEAEVQANPARRALYRDYCRMQKACQLLAADFQDTEELPAGGKVIAFAGASSPSRSRRPILMASAATVAAACVALVFLRPGNQPALETSADTLAATPALPAQSNGVGTVQEPKAAPRGLISVAGRNDPAKLTLVDSLVLSPANQAGLGINAEMRPLDDQLSWMKNFKLVSIQERKELDQLRFDAPPPSLRPDRRQLGARAPAEATVEMTAFRFVK